MRLFGITIGSSECVYAFKGVFLGHIVDKNEIKPIIENLMKIQALPAPFLGMS